MTGIRLRGSVCVQPGRLQRESPFLSMSGSGARVGLTRLSGRKTIHFQVVAPLSQDTFVTRQSSDPIANTPPSLSQLTGAHKVYNHFSVLLGLKTFAFSCSHYKALRPRGKRLGQPLQVHTPHQKSSDMCSYRSRRSSRDIVHLLTPCPGVPQTLTVLTSEERNHEGMF